MDNTIKSVIRDAIAISVIASSITRLIDAIVEHANVCDEKMSDTVRKNVDYRISRDVWLMV